MYDLICDVISFCVWSRDVCNINLYDKIVIEKKKKRENMEIKDIFLHKKGWFRNRNHSLLRRADTRGSTDIIYRSNFAGQPLLITSLSRSRT